MFGQICLVAWWRKGLGSWASDLQVTILVCSHCSVTQSPKASHSHFTPHLPLFIDHYFSEVVRVTTGLAESIGGLLLSLSLA